MVNIATRASWGARHADGDLTLAHLATAVALHHDAGANLAATATVAQEQARMRQIEQTGQNRTRAGIGYRGVVIFPSGRAYQGTSWNRRGAHVGGHNSDVVAICFAGNFETAQPTAAALATAAEILREGRGRWFIANAPLRPHSHWRPTACPGRNLTSRIPEILQAANASAPAPAPAPAPGRTVAQMATEVIAGRHGVGHAARQRSLGVDNATYALVRAEVNRILAGGAAATAPAPAAPARTIAQMATEVIAGRHGVGHAARQRSLGVDNATYAAVRAEVNRRLR